MSERKDEKWLDNQLRRVVDGTTPVFDTESWKQKYSKEYEALLARGKQIVGWGLPHRFRACRRWWWGKPHPTVRIPGDAFGKVAIAAAILVSVGMFFVNRTRDEPIPPVAKPQLLVQSPARMLSMMSLRMVYQQGGAEALDRQFQDTLNVFGPRSLSMSMQDLFEGVNGS